MLLGSFLLPETTIRYLHLDLTPNSPTAVTKGSRNTSHGPGIQSQIIKWQWIYFSMMSTILFVALQFMPENNVFAMILLAACFPQCVCLLGWGATNLCCRSPIRRTFVCLFRAKLGLYCNYAECTLSYSFGERIYNLAGSRVWKWFCASTTIGSLRTFPFAEFHSPSVGSTRCVFCCSILDSSSKVNIFKKLVPWQIDFGEIRKCLS